MISSLPTSNIGFIERSVPASVYLPKQNIEILKRKFLTKRLISSAVNFDGIRSSTTLAALSPSFVASCNAVVTVIVINKSMTPVPSSSSTGI